MSRDSRPSDCTATITTTAAVVAGPRAAHIEFGRWRRENSSMEESLREFRQAHLQGYFPIELCAFPSINLVANATKIGECVFVIIPRAMPRLLFQLGRTSRQNIVFTLFQKKNIKARSMTTTTNNNNHTANNHVNNSQEDVIETCKANAARAAVDDNVNVSEYHVTLIEM